MKLNEFVTRLALLTGTPKDNEELIAWQAAVGEIEIPDTLSGAINTKLLTLDTAKNSSELKNHFTAAAYDGIDAKIKDLIGSSELTEEVKTKILTEKNSFEKMSLLNAATKEHFKAQGDPANDTELKGKNKTLADEVTKLNADMTLLRESSVDRGKYDALVVSSENNMRDLQARWEDFQTDHATTTRQVEVDQAKITQLQQRCELATQRLTRMQEEQATLMDQSDNQAL